MAKRLLRHRRTRRAPFIFTALAGLALAAGTGAAHAQATVKTDGKWRHALGAGGSVASGNSTVVNLTLTGESVLATPDSKWSINGRALQSRFNGQTTADNSALGTQYDQSLSGPWFAFAKADYLRDRRANLSARTSGSAGLGKHLLRSETHTFDVSTGLGYVQDRYANTALVDGEPKSRYGRMELVLGEASTHKLGQTTSLRQKLGVFSNLEQGSKYRVVFDAGVSVAMTSSLSLTAGLSHRYDSAPTLSLNRSDTLFVTGLSVKLD